MTASPVDWTQDPPLDPDLEYRALVRSLRRSRAFGLWFVQCSPAAGQQLIDRVTADLPQKTMEVLTLEQSITTLYDIIAALPNRDQIDVLFIQGLELSLYEYEREKLWQEPEDRYGYSEGSVPKLLAHLNLSRERFQHQFPFQIVMLLPLFALKYLMRRAPDFFDWRSGVLEFAGEPDRVQAAATQLWREFDYEKYCAWTQPQRNQKILEIQALLEEPQQTPEQQAQLSLQQALLYQASEQHEAAKMKYCEAISNYERTLKVNPDKYEVWYKRGILLGVLKREEDAIASYDHALEIQLDNEAAWYNRGNALGYLGRYEDAIASYDRVLEIKPDNAAAWYNKSRCYALGGKVDAALDSLQRAIELNPDYRQSARTDADFDGIRQEKRFQVLLATSDSA